MPDRVKEKLVEQKIKGGAESICAKCFHNKVCKAMDNQPCIECNQFVDAHGVTVQEWISVKDRLPEAKERVLTVDDSGYVVVNCISIRFGGWFSEAFGEKRITHWMPLPQPPKE